MEKYPLWFENKQIGDILVVKKGLYYRFECVCNMPVDFGYRIRVHCGTKITDLGICIPENGYFVLRMQLPMKRIGDGEMQFFLENHRQSNSALIPIFANKPFMEIENLENAKLVMKDGMHYACFR